MKKGATVKESVQFKRNIKKRKKRANKSQAPKYKWVEAEKKVAPKIGWYQKVWNWIKNLIKKKNDN